MDKEYRYIDKLGRHINWNSLIPPLLDTWLAIKATKDVDTGEIVVRVVEESAAKIHTFIPSHSCAHEEIDEKTIDSTVHFYCKECAICSICSEGHTQEKPHREVPYCEYRESLPLLCMGQKVSKDKPNTPHYFCSRCGDCASDNCSNCDDIHRHTSNADLLAIQYEKAKAPGVEAVKHSALQALMKKIADQQIEINRYSELCDTLKNNLHGAKGTLSKIYFLPVRWRDAHNTLQSAQRMAKERLNELE